MLETKCDVIVFIDDDVLLPKDFVWQHLKNYTNPDIAAIAGRVIQENWTPPPRPTGQWPAFMDSAFLDRAGTNRLVGIGDFPGCNHSLRVDVLRRIGGYDENYNVGAAIREESDLAVRLWKSGHRIDFDPEAWLRHLAVPAGGCRPKPELSSWMKSFSQLYFAFRHLYPGYWFWEQLCFRIPRAYVFCKQNVVKPWRLPGASAAYIQAMILAGCRVRSQTRHRYANVSEHQKH